MTTPPRLDLSLTRDLERASLYRFMSLLFQPPSSEVAGELAALVPSLPSRHQGTAAAIAAEASPDLSAAYQSLVGGSGSIPDSESDYSENPLAGKGPIIADVAGFYAAFSYGAPAELRLQPDHLAMELDFVAYLAMKAAFAGYANLEGERSLCEDATATFRRDHLARWAPLVLDRIAERGGDGFHACAARFALDVLTTEPEV